MKSYIKLPILKSLPDSSIKKRQLFDDVWLNYIFFIVLKYYKEINNNDVIALINNELEKQNSPIEKVLKEHIYNWYKRIKRTDKIDIWGIILNLEPSSECFEGFYDLKFQHSDWKKYFVFEAKNLGEIKSTKHSTMINEYVYSNHKDDGGMHRFMTKKYACEIDFGGMLGFVVGKTNEDIIKDLSTKIQSVYCENINGILIDEKIKLNSIAENKNTFTTFHSRNGEKFSLYHILLDFTKDLT
jgi:hypothetical protein